MSREDVVAAEVAEDEFTRFVEMMDLDVDLSGMDEEDRRSFENEKRIFLRAVRRGRLTVDDQGQPTFRTQDDRELVFAEPTGATLMEMDRAKSGKDVRKTYMLLAAITKSMPQTFSAMPLRDLKVCQAIMGFFMGG
jgi:hypothetical protein